ncbi:MAG: hypothetical protein IKD31_05745 [Clostridia bacterium]|nr:hypothetical protein [Clostridia bacterium]
MKRNGKTLLALILLCSTLLGACAPSLQPADSEDLITTETVSSATEEEKTTSPDEPTTTYDAEAEKKKAETIQKLSAILTNKLSAAKVEALPIATSQMTKAELRQLCIDFFRLQLTFQWIPNMDVKEWPLTYASAAKTIDFGSVYGGIPYQSTGTGSLYRWLEYYDEETGVFDMETAFRENGGVHKTDVETDASGKTTYFKWRYMMIFFNQCSVASFWGWGRVINSANYAWTADMTVKNGFIPVGGYTYGYEYGGKYYGPETIDRFGEKSTYNPQKYDTGDVIADWNKKNGPYGMYECYAQLQPADLLVDEGHTRMVKSVHVVKTITGVIDANQSYVITLDQIEGWGVKSNIGLVPYKIQGGIDKKYTFASLQKNGYIPFTFAEFLEEGDPRLATYESSTMSRYSTFAEEVKGKTGTGVEKSEVYCTVASDAKLTLTQLNAVVVGSNYPISDVFVNVLDRDGNVVHTNIYRATSARVREVAMTSQHASWAPGRTLTWELKKFADGNHRVQIVLQISTGEKPVAYCGELIP